MGRGDVDVWGVREGGGKGAVGGVDWEDGGGVGWGGAVMTVLLSQC